MVVRAADTHTHEENESVYHGLEPILDRIIRMGADHVKNAESLEKLRRHLAPGLRTMIGMVVPSAAGVLIGLIPDEWFHSKTAAELFRGSLSEIIENFCRILHEGGDAPLEERSQKAADEVAAIAKKYMDQEVLLVYGWMHLLDCQSALRQIADLKKRPSKKDKDGNEIPGTSENLDGSVGKIVLSDGLARGHKAHVGCCMQKLMEVQAAPKAETKKDKPAKRHESVLEFVSTLELEDQQKFHEMQAACDTPEKRESFVKGMRFLDTKGEFKSLALMFEKSPALFFGEGLQMLEDRDWSTAFKNFLRDVSDESAAARKPLVALCRWTKDKYLAFDNDMAHRAYWAETRYRERVARPVPTWRATLKKLITLDIFS